MHLQAGELIFSPSDLSLFSKSPFASWMEHLHVTHPELSPEPDVNDSMTAVLQKEGVLHELGELLKFEAQGLRVTNLADSNRIEDSIEAMRAGADVIYQAPLALIPFKGRADFLVKVTGQSVLGDYHYEVWDSKLAKSVKPEFILQLCCYSEMLETIQGKRPENIVVSLGSGEHKRLALREYIYYYLHLKKKFLAAHSGFNPDQCPDPSLSGSYERWSAYAKQIFFQQDHLAQVANIRKTHIRKLQKAGISTMQSLIESGDNVKGINRQTLARLKAQAAIQKASQNKEIPLFRILEHPEDTGFYLLPPACKTDVFFDIEGDPLYEGGLEYLWGVTYFAEDGSRQYKDFWAHDAEEEKDCFNRFIQWVYQRWIQDPSMHIYHYASYEISACRRLMGRYGICEYEVDQLLRNGVFVDLYKIVKNALLVGEPRYSIKNIEHLYRPKRETEVASGGDSVAVYEHWRENPDGHDWQSSKILKSIRDYNRDDCDSTQELVDWLRDRQSAAGITYSGNNELVDPELKEAVTQAITLRNQLLDHSETLIQKSQPEEAAMARLLAWCLEFHRRERKPLIWKLYERMDMNEEELLEDIECLALCSRTGKEPYLPTPKSRNLAYEYQFDSRQEFKANSSSYYVLGKKGADGRNLKVTLEKEGSRINEGFITLQMKEALNETITLIPDDYINPDPIPAAIYAQAGRFIENQLFNTAIGDFLSRAYPRIKNRFPGQAIALSHDPATRLRQIIDAVLNLDNSYLVIQGPPGAGKTYTAKHIIAELLMQGKKIGVTSNAYKALNHLLCCSAEYCQENGIKGHFVSTKDSDGMLERLNIKLVKNKDMIDELQDACVIGSTAWGFSRVELEAQFDYLFVDEAGQVSVANLIAMSQSARNIILMGDQMQLPQPCQGNHPEESGSSILDYLLHHSPTISEECGIFLGTTYRMHPAVNAFISEMIYEGKLETASSNHKRIIEVPEGYEGVLNKEAGIIAVPVVHEGNTQASEEEVEVIKTLAQQLCGRTYIETDGTRRAISWSDMLFVAPYNHQVNKLQFSLGPKAKVGTVDRFQGQEEAIVFLSMCASDGEESPRGLNFLLDKNRLNVAVSRAKCLAIVVYSPSLPDASAVSLEQLKQVNLFCRLLT